MAQTDTGPQHANSAAGVAPGEMRSSRVFFYRVREWSGVLLGFAVLGVLVTAALSGPTPYDPLVSDPSSILQAPSGEHPFGTDRNGFDILARTFEAAKTDLLLAIEGIGVALVIGVTVGLFASVRGATGEIIMRGLDAFQAFPLVVLSIAVVTLMGNNVENIVFAIAIINFPRFARLVRSQALTLRESLFVQAAVAFGASKTRVLFRHILPNTTELILAQVSIGSAHAIRVIASLTFLGIGVSPPTPTWGAMIRKGSRQVLSGEWWTFAFPGLFVVVTVIAFNLIADGIESRRVQRHGT